MPLKRKHLLPAVALMAMLGLLLALGWWVGELRARGTDAEMRKDLLRQTVEIANTINPELARKLTFTAADKDTPAFEHLRKHLIAAGKRFPQRGIYTMVLREGTIFFGPETTSESDPIASPPGTQYKQPPAEAIQVFKDKRPVTVGPVTDEFGTLISALAPVLDPHTGEVLMVVGVDILASDWQARLNAVRRGPLLIMLVSILLLSGGTIAIRRRNRHMKPGTLKFRAWIVAPTALAMLGGLMLYGAYEYQEFDEETLHEILRVTEHAQGEWNRNVASEVQLLKAQIDHIARNPGMLKAWQDRDLSTLTGLTQPVHAQLKREYRITHFYFMAPDRTIFLRAHQPDRRGDLIDRSTLLDAEQTGEDSWGIELGPLGTFTLRYVRPWKQDGTTTGYLELGMEIEHLARQLARDMNLDLLTVIRKEYTSREKFETGRQAFGFAGQWDDYSDFVVAHQTIPVLPGEVAHWLEQDHNLATEIGVFNMRLGETQFACGSIHLPDATGRSVADLIVMLDVTAEADKAQSTLIQNLSIAIVLFGGALVLLWSVTGTAERQLDTSFARLRESGESYRRQFSDNATVMLLFDPTDGAIIDANAAALSFYGYSRERLLAMRITEINTLPAVEVQRCIASVTREHGQKFEFQHRLADGSVRDVEVSSSLIHLDARKVLHSIIHDITERKRAEQTQVRLVAMLDATPGFVGFADARDTHILHINPAGRKMVGVQAQEDVTQLKIADVHPEWTNKLFRDKIIPTALRDGMWTGECAFMNRDGHEIPVMMALLAHKSPSGEVERFSTVSIDITERKRAAEALRESEERFQQLFDLMARGVAIYQGVDDGQDFVFVDINRAGQSLGKIRLDEAVGRRVTEVFPEVERNGLLDVFRHVWRTGQPEHHPLSEYVDGHLQQRVENHVLKLPSGLIVAIYSDITEKHRAEEALQDSEERHRKIIEASNEAILLRSGGVVIYANPAALKLFRANDPGDLIGKQYLDLVHPDDRALSAERVKKNVDENWIASPREHRILTLDGQGVHVESTGVPVKYRGKTQVFGVFRDITARKLGDQEKEKLEGQLRQAQKLEAIGTLAGGIAHDFNNILSVIIGNTEILNLADDISVSSRDGLDQILAASQRATQLVSQILAFSRRGKQEKILIDLKPIVKETLEFLRASLPATIQLQHYLEPDYRDHHGRPHPDAAGFDESVYQCGSRHGKKRRRLADRAIQYGTHRGGCAP